MKKVWLAASALALLTGNANAETIGISMVSFDDNFQTLLRTGMEEMAGEMGVDVQIEDAQYDVAKQLDQINNFIASGVDAIVVTVVDSSSANALSSAAEAGGVPLVYVNIEPGNADALPDNQAFVGSNEIESGTMGAYEACLQLRAAGKSNGANGYILAGNFIHQAAVQRTKDVHDVIGMDMCNFIAVAGEEEGKWSRDTAQNIMTNWLSTGEPVDVVFANNDEMAIGAIQALKSVGTDMEDVIVVGVDATQDALVAMQAGELDVTVFQNAKAQGSGALEAALDLARGEDVDQKVYIPFELVTPDNIEGYISAN
ncbi:substrate-binding domain-containing protein [Maritimibacter dapengensis]|uniref:Substrate-binding domain-containing protein n=1 Tax=Maritimibacter dapengensis TaxID=2836868 RepID=A0ABS6T888_9RHOB|nr:substrate-binding domain-containing protein [Maritimibacter dapengensis]MBV7380822.1 substrate-binding domain-containing protein [Maritimibacter dapengensis]